VGLVLALAAFAISGCKGGNPYEVKTVPAAGTVTYQGKPLTKGSILFRPEDENGRPASGTISEDGRFTLTTFNEGDGAVPGKHLVGVVVTEETMKKGGDTGIKYIVPEKYSIPSTSGVEAVVPPEGSRDLKVEIK